jgi:hypothetical protein
MLLTLHRVVPNGISTANALLEPGGTPSPPTVAKGGVLVIQPAGVSATSCHSEQLSHKQTSVWPRLVKEKIATGLVPMTSNFTNCKVTTGGGSGLAGLAKQSARVVRATTTINTTTGLPTMPQLEQNRHD